MRRKIAAVLTGLALILGFSLATTAPAHADSLKAYLFHANNPDGTPADYVVSYWKDAGSTGIGVNYIIGECNANYWEFGWDNPALDGHELWITNVTTGSKVWTRGETDSNVTIGSDGVCWRKWTVNEFYSNAHEIKVRWDLTLQINLQVDQNPAIGTVDIVNA